MAEVYLDTTDTALIYAFDLPGRKGKVVIRINYAEKVRSGELSKKITANFIMTGGIVEAGNLTESRYVLLNGT